MNKLFFTAVLFLLANTQSFSQDFTKDFEFILPNYKVSNSLYKKIDLLDSRVDNKKIGIVGVGLLKNIDAQLIFKPSFATQLTSVFNALIDSTAKDGELLFQLKQFNFVEDYGTRYCYFNAALYSKKDDQYKKIALIDTVILITVADVTKALIKEQSKIITGFIANNLLQTSADTALYTIHDVGNIDSVEKQKIPLYTTTTYIDGLYTTYTSFFKQVPDMQGIVELRKDGSISSIKIIDSSGKKIKVKSANLYAVINKGIRFIATQYGYYPLIKMDDDFIFTGNIKISASNGDMSSAQLMLGLAGSLLTKTGNEENFDIMIDPLNGSFIHLRRIPPPIEN